MTSKDLTIGNAHLSASPVTTFAHAVVDKASCSSTCATASSGLTRSLTLMFLKVPLLLFRSSATHRPSDGTRLAVPSRSS